ncbi:hypothetical protein Len3610_13750 [Lentibacillus sp. CBA3610]|nr:hypothetical protein Len3610_13750 [Lentibacillus sp. CBA3610]
MLSRQKQRNQGKIGEYSNKRSLPVLPLSPHCTKAKDGNSENRKGYGNDPIREEAKARLTVRKVKNSETEKSVPEPGMGNIQVQDEWEQMHGRGDGQCFHGDSNCTAFMHNIRKSWKVYFTVRRIMKRPPEGTLYKDTG